MRIASDGAGVDSLAAEHTTQTIDYLQEWLSAFTRWGHSRS